jgi:SAM-dependent methyltransferase
VLEAGCGTARDSIFLSYFSELCVAVDLNKDVVIKAKKNKLKFGGQAEFVVADAFSPPFKDKSFDVCFSQGLLEHFKPYEVSKIMSTLSRVCKQMIHSVPSNYYPSKDFGDERLLDPVSWQKLLREYGINSRANYYHLDLQGFKNQALSFKAIKPWHILIRVPVKERFSERAFHRKL